MFKNLFRSVSTVKQLCKSIDLKHIERLDIIIWNPSNKSILKTDNFEATLIIKKDDMKLYKNFSNDDYETLLEDVNTFVNTEIKI
jgi:hypothetical protein